ncbi:MAG TPA: peptidoglycan DD-metalloendopeptidase family protein [Leptolyngbyaceae cyanobacterium M65_K2018_010]|nr:peptidoglycan DD-metalloendopeptidase family protein [Leptolyngbyaceae cyanobacterium M65_K2018_010]
MSGVFRPQVNAPVTMLGLALSLGASASLVSIPEMALAAEGSSVLVLPAIDREAQSGGSPLPSSPVSESTTAYYTVAEGDSLWQIATEHEADVDTLKAVNGLSSDEVLQVGQVLRVPNGDSAIATVKDNGSQSLAKAKSILGGVGGEIPALMPHPSAVAVLSVDQLEKGLAGLDSDLSSLEPDAPMVEAEEGEEIPELQADEDLDETARVGRQLQARVTEPATPSVALEARESWQDSAVHLALAKSAETAQAAVEPTQSVATALPDSLPLNNQPKPSLSAASSSAGTNSRGTAPRAGQPTAEPVTSGSTPVVADRGPSLGIDPAAATAQIASVGATQAATSAAPVSREQVIQQHLARIRDANSAAIDREALNARIRQAREELQLARTLPAEPVTQSTARALTAGDAARTNSESATPQSLAALPAAVIAPASAKEGSLQSQTWTVTDVATTEVEAEPMARVDLSSMANSTDGELQARADLPGARGGGELLAAAPLGPEAYRPFPDAPTGQMVSPNMPMLPGADQFLPAAPNRFNGYVWPTRGTLTSGYGWRWGRMHRGVDIAGPVGTPIVAAASGVVVRSGWNSGGYGNLVDIRHADGSMTRYAHNNRLLVREGQQVAQGQQIAEMGSTGFSTGPHLHFEIHLPNSGTVNPMAFLPSR